MEKDAQDNSSEICIAFGGVTPFITRRGRFPVTAELVHVLLCVYDQVDSQKTCSFFSRGSVTTGFDTLLPNSVFASAGEPQRVAQQVERTVSSATTLPSPIKDTPAKHTRARKPGARLGDRGKLSVSDSRGIHFLFLKRSKRPFAGRHRTPSKTSLPDGIDIGKDTQARTKMLSAELKVTRNSEHSAR